jgi:hypothetical protein
MSKQLGVVCFCLLFVIGLLSRHITCPPVLPDRGANMDVSTPHMTANETLENDPILSLEYHRYLKEVVNILESDQGFKRMIENASTEDIKSGKIASHLEFVDHNIRTKLDELKRKEIDRLRTLIARKAALNSLKPHEIENLLPKHVDHSNVETFESNDLEILVKQATVDLEEIDKLRRADFKDHEIQKEYDRRVKLKEMDDTHRKQAEEEYKKQMEQHQKHEKINHPGSKDQLEEVWEEQDHLEGNDFNPHTFFDLHDIDGNKYWDQMELESLFQIELDKIYNTSDPLYDPREREEEANRMREHVIKEIDKNKDGLVSLDEFLEQTKQREFEKNDDWKNLEEEPQFNQQEFENFSRHMGEERAPTQPTPHTNPTQHHQ